MGHFLSFMQKLNGPKLSEEMKTFLDTMKDKDIPTISTELGKKFNLSEEEITSAVNAWQECK